MVLLAVLLSALAVVYTKHQSRKLFVEMQALNSQQDALGVEWGRLLLEQGTLATPTRIEQAARKRLGMRVPEPDQILIVEP